MGSFILILSHKTDGKIEVQPPSNPTVSLSSRHKSSVYQPASVFFRARSLSLFFFFVEALPTVHILFLFSVLHILFFFFGYAWSLLWHVGSSLQSAGFSSDLRAPELTGLVVVVCGAL